MTLDWQNLAALGIVLAATVYLVRRAWRTIVKKRAGGCGACGSCPATNANPVGSGNSTGKTLVELKTFVKPRT